MLVVSDTSPLNYLLLTGQIGVLPVLFDRVVAPPAVIAEMCQAGAPEVVARWADSPPAWLEIIAPSTVDASLRLDIGESEAIALARELHAHALLIDERKATAVARQLGLTVTSTLSVLALAAAKGLLDLPATVAALRQTNFRAPPDLLEQMLKEDRERRARSTS